MNHYDRLDELDQERQQVQEAAERLLTGNGRASNGRLNISALAVESGINRTTLYQRYPDLVADFRARIALTPASPTAQALQGQFDAAQARIKELETDNAALQQRVRTLSGIITEMSVEIEQMRREPNPRDNIVALPTRRRS